MKLRERTLRLPEPPVAAEVGHLLACCTAERVKVDYVLRQVPQDA